MGVDSPIYEVSCATVSADLPYCSINQCVSAANANPSCSSALNSFVCTSQGLFPGNFIANILRQT